MPGPLGPLGFDFAQHRQTLRPSVDGIRSKALRPVAFGPLGPLGFDFAQHRQTRRPPVVGIRSKAFRSFRF